MSRFSGKTLSVAQSDLTNGRMDIAPGTYRAIISDVSEVKTYQTQNENSKGLPYIDVTYRIVEAPEGLGGKGASIKQMRVPLKREWNSGKVNFTFDQFWQAVGAYDAEAGAFQLPSGDDELQDLIDPDFTVILTIKEEPGYKDPTRLYAVVNRVDPDDGRDLKAFPRTEAPAPAAVPTAAAATSGPVTNSTQTKWNF